MIPLGLRLIVLVVILGGVGARNSNAQSSNARSNNSELSVSHNLTVWTTKQGLPQNSVNALVQTTDGFLWLGTYDGLVRFDGADFRVYRTNSYPGNRITTLLVTHENEMWIGTENGLARFSNGIFIPFPLELGLSGVHVDALLQDEEGTIWVSAVGDQGSLLATISGESLNVIHSEKSGSIGGAHLLTTDRSGNLWTEWRNDIYRISGKGLERFKLPFLAPDDLIRSMSHAADGSLWIGSRYGRIIQIKERSIKLVYTLKAPPGGFDVYYFDETGPSLWVASSAGVQHYASGTLVEKLENPRSGNADVRTVFKDAQRNIWFGADGDGLIRVSESIFEMVDASVGLENEIALSVTSDAQGVVWLGTNCGGIYRVIDGVASPFRVPEIPKDTCGFSVLAASNGDIWVGHKTLTRIRGNQITVFDQRHGLAPNPGSRSDFILALYEDPLDPGVLWVGTHSGMHKYDEGRLTRYTRQDGLVSNQVRGFVRDGSGLLWITTRNGLSSFDGHVFKSYTVEDGLPSNDVRALHYDSKGQLWVGTYGAGIVRIDDDSFTTVSSADGMIEDVVSSIIERDGWFWMSGNHGIHRASLESLSDVADGKESKVVSIGYQEEAGLTNPETNGGFQPSAWQAADGRIWFPTLAGFAVVDPDRISSTSSPLLPQITDVQVLDDWRNAGSVVELTTEERSFRLRFTAPDMVAPERVSFLYRLLGYDEGWVDASGRREAFYTKVPPGEYTFEVLARNREGVWSQEAASIALILAPFWYERGLFKLALILTLILLLGGSVSFRYRQHARQTLRLNRLVEDRTVQLRDALSTVEEQSEKLTVLDSARTRFFHNTSHEFRTPLSLIIGPLDEMLEDPTSTIPDSYREDLALMRRHAGRMQHLINQLLDLAKLDSGVLSINRSPVDLVEMLRSEVSLFESVADLKKINLQFQSSLSSLPYCADTDKLEIIFTNLISNAVKYSPEGAFISVQLQIEGTESILIRVTDTGPGITPEHLEAVFDRFYQTSLPSNRDLSHDFGTGIGLALTKELVELHEGRISVSNNPNMPGASFLVCLPSSYMLEFEASDKEEDQSDAMSSPVTADTELDTERGSEASGKSQILIVEDNADLRNFLSSVLSSYDVIMAENGQEGFEIAQKQIPDLIISDIMMPVLDGLEMCTRIKADEYTSHIPLILLTAKTGSESRIEGLQAGADDYLAKPFNGSELRTRVANLITQRDILKRRYSALTKGGKGTPPKSLELPEAEQKFLSRIEEEVNRSIDDPAFGVDHLAYELHMSRRQLSRKLKAIVDESPGVMIKRIRLEHAAELLAGSDLTVQEVADRIGYQSTSHFSSAFTDRFGVPPSSYR